MKWRWRRPPRRRPSSGLPASPSADGCDGLDDGRSGIGLESGVGLALRLGRRLTLMPGIAYAAYPVGDPGGVSHLRAEVGLRLRP